MSTLQMTPRLTLGRVSTVGLIAGSVGGLAEVLWVWLIAPLTGGDPAAVANAVTETVFPALAAGALGFWLGLAIHFVLAAALGVAVALGVERAFPRIAGTALGFGLVVAALALVWVINFNVILPVVNPAFIGLLPLWASLISKLLFGVAAAAALRSLR